MKCYSCGAQIREESRFCAHCGADQSKRPAEETYCCCHCGKEIAPASKFCTYCGGDQSKQPVPADEVIPAQAVEELPAQIPDEEISAPAAEEAPAQEIPEESAAEEVPAEEVSEEPAAEEAPAEEVSEEPAAEEAPADQAPEEPAAEEAPAQAISEPVAAEPAAAPEPEPAPAAEPEPAPAPAPEPQPAPQPQYQQPPYGYQQPQYGYQQPPYPQYTYQRPVMESAPPQYQRPIPTPRPAYQLPTGRSLVKMIFLSILTLGIYPVVIFTRISEEINMVASRYDGKRTIHFMWLPILGALTLMIYPFVWIHGLCNRIGDELHRRNIAYKFSAATYWLWTLLYPFVGLVIAGALGVILTSIQFPMIYTYLILGAVSLISMVGPMIYMHKFMKAMNLVNADYNNRG